MWAVLPASAFTSTWMSAKKSWKLLWRRQRESLPVIAHVGCNNTADSVELAAHAQSVGADAIASIPPIYFHLPEYAIAEYWNAMSAAAPVWISLFITFLSWQAPLLSMNLLKEMLKTPTLSLLRTLPCPPGYPAFKAEVYISVAKMDS